MKRKNRHLFILIAAVLCLGALFSGIVTADANKAIKVNTTVKGKPEKKGAYDQYSFTLSSPGKVNLILGHENEFNTKIYWTVELYASDLKTQLQTFNSIGTDTSLKGASLGLSAGQYYVRVYAGKDCSHEYSGKPYTLKVAYSASKTWEIEYNSASKQGNDSQATATRMKLGEYSDGSVRNAQDVDFFQFTIPSRGYIQLGFAHTNVYDSKNTWSVKLINSKTETVYELLSKGTKTYRTSPKIGLSAGTYYLKVSGISSQFSDKDYHVRVNFKKTTKWEQEYSEKKHIYNSAMGSANTLKLNKTYQGTLSLKNDEDFFKFKLNSRKRVSVKFSHSYIAKRSRFWTVTLYDSQTRELKSFTSKGVQTTVTKNWMLNPGTYFIKVNKAKYWKNNIYKITLK